MKKTINDLTVTKTFYKRDKDIFGNRTKEPYQKEVKRNVEVVTGWVRFGHYMIDAVIIGIISFAISLVMLAGFNYPSCFNSEVDESIFRFIPSIQDIIITFMYYYLCEKTMQRTIGKFATNSVVINQFAEAPDLGSLMGRTFSRLVPFEAFSCFSDRGWHDRWSNTYVVKTQERDRLKKLLANQDGIFISDNPDLLD